MRLPSRPTTRPWKPNTARPPGSLCRICISGRVRSGSWAFGSRNGSAWVSGRPWAITGMAIPGRKSVTETIDHPTLATGFALRMWHHPGLSGAHRKPVVSLRGGGFEDRGDCAGQHGVELDGSLVDRQSLGERPREAGDDSMVASET